jgi:hypothetical protein
LKDARPVGIGAKVFVSVAREPLKMRIVILVVTDPAPRR